MMAMLDPKILKRGRHVTDDALEQMKAPERPNGQSYHQPVH